LRELGIKTTLAFIEFIMFFIIFFTGKPVLVIGPLIFYIGLLYICLKHNIVIVDTKKPLLNQITDLLGWPAIFLIFYIMGKEQTDLIVAFVFSGIALIKGIYLTGIYSLNPKKLKLSP